MEQRIIVTGSTGYLAKYVIDKLLSHGSTTVIATYRNNTGEYKQNDKLFFEKVDLLKLTSFETIFKKHSPTALIHLAAMARVKDGELHPVEAINTNLTASIALLDLCEKYKVKTALIASSNLAQGAVSTVGLSKLLVEQAILKNSFTTQVILYRVPNILDSKGAVTHIFRRLITDNKPITITHPEMSRSFISGENAANEVLYLLNEGEDKGIYVSYKEPKPIISLAKEMMADMGKELPVEIVGMRPGEKLSEHVFTENDVYKTKVPYLGKLRNYNFNAELTVSSIKKLNEKTEIRVNSNIQNLLASVF